MADTEVTQVIHNLLTKTQFDGASTISSEQLYYVDPELDNDAVVVTDENGELESVPQVNMMVTYSDGTTATFKILG